MTSQDFLGLPRTSKSNQNQPKSNQIESKSNQNRIKILVDNSKILMIIRVLARNPSRILVILNN